MKRAWILHGICTTMAVIFLSVCINTQNGVLAQRNETLRSPFRYVIFRNKFEQKLTKKDYDRRFVGVLLDAKSFSKENLISLFRLLLKRFPSPRLLTIEVFTRLEDVETPEETEQSRNSDIINVEMTSNQAVLIRNNEKMFFYIYFENGDFDEVEIK